MKVLRISMGFPTNGVPGMGLPCYYHNKYSKYTEMIITIKRNSKFLEVINKDTTFIALNHRLVGLGEIKQKKIKSLYLIIKKTFNQFLFLLKSIKHIKKFKPDIVHSYSPIPFLIGIYSKIFFKSKFIISLHGTDVFRIKKNRFFTMTLKYADEILAVGDSMKTNLNNYNFSKKIKYIGNGVDLEKFICKNKPRRKTFLSIANFRWQKNHKLLINAFFKFQKKFKDYKLILIGQGELKEKIKSQINKLKLDKNVILKGTLDREEIVNELNKTKSLILSSTIEGFPKVILEAMATGTPVLSTDVGNVSKVIKDSGIIVENDNIDELHKGMIDIICEKNWLNKSLKSQEFSKSYSWTNIAMGLEKIYEGCLENASK